MPAVLSDKKADLIPAVLPFSFNPKAEARKERSCLSKREALGVTQMIVWTARKSFIEKNRAAMVDFMEDMLVITRWYRTRKITTRSPRSRPSLRRRRPSASAGSSPNRTPIAIRTLYRIVEALQRNVDMTRELGFVKKKIDIKQYSDLSLVQEAAKRLK